MKHKWVEVKQGMTGEVLRYYCSVCDRMIFPSKWLSFSESDNCSPDTVESCREVILELRKENARLKCDLNEFKSGNRIPVKPA